MTVNGRQCREEWPGFLDHFRLAPRTLNRWMWFRAKKSIFLCPVIFNSLNSYLFFIQTFSQVHYSEQKGGNEMKNVINYSLSQVMEDLLGFCSWFVFRNLESLNYGQIFLHTFIDPATIFLQVLSLVRWNTLLGLARSGRPLCYSLMINVHKCFSKVLLKI